MKPAAKIVQKNDPAQASPSLHVLPESFSEPSSSPRFLLILTSPPLSGHSGVIARMLINYRDFWENLCNDWTFRLSSTKSMVNVLLDPHLFLFLYLTQFSATSLSPSLYGKQSRSPMADSGRERAYGWHLKNVLHYLKAIYTLIARLNAPSWGTGTLVLWNKVWVCLPTPSKANLLTPSHGEGKCSVHCRYQAKNPGS